MAVEHGESPTEYIAHHLTHLKVGSGFWTWHIDTLFMAALLAFAVSGLLWIAARRLSNSAAPTGLAGFVEWIYDWVDQQVAGIYPGDRRFMTALALTLFSWVVAMNTMDLLPVDLPGHFASVFGVKFWRVLPTSDLNATIAEAIVVLALVIIFSIRAKGIGGYLHEWAAAPFGIWLFPFNIVLNFIELLFILIALLGFVATGFSVGSIVAFSAQVLFGAGWAIFHILIVLLQAYIFMVLPIVYIAMAEEHH